MEDLAEGPKPVPEQFQQEINDYQKLLEEGHPEHFFSNLPAYLPGPDGEPGYKKIPGIGESWYKKHKDSHPASEHGRFSELFLNQSPDEFSKTAQSVVEELGISLDPKKTQEYYDLMLKVYLRLREMGYGRDEIIM